MYMYMYAPLCTDPTLTIRNLCLVTASVQNWYHLGWYRGGLGVPEAVRNEIRASIAYQTNHKRKEALLLYYLLTIPMASWSSLAGALHYNKEKTALDAVKGFLEDTPAGQSPYLHVYTMYMYNVRVRFRVMWMCSVELRVCT